MTVTAQLTHLRRQFPNAPDLAVSREIADGYMEEMTRISRFTSLDGPWRFPYEQAMAYRGCEAVRLPLTFRGVPLVLVTPA